MPTPLKVASYPSLLLEAVTYAQAHGELIIPSENPKALRLQIHGLFGALRRENRTELCDDLGAYISPDGKNLILRRKEKTQMGQELAAALALARSGNSPVVPSLPEPVDAEAAFDRIFNTGKKP